MTVCVSATTNKNRTYLLQSIRMLLLLNARIYIYYNKKYVCLNMIIHYYTTNVSEVGVVF